MLIFSVFAAWALSLINLLFGKTAIRKNVKKNSPSQMTSWDLNEQVYSVVTCACASYFTTLVFSNSRKFPARLLSAKIGKVIGDRERNYTAK